MIAKRAAASSRSAVSRSTIVASPSPYDLKLELYDDRDAGPGEKFADAELLGCPLRLTVGRRSLESGEIEVQVRRGRAQAPGLPLAGERAELVRRVDELWQSLP